MARVWSGIVTFGIAVTLLPVLGNCTGYTSELEPDAGDSDATEPRDTPLDASEPPNDASALGDAGDGGVTGEVGVTACDPAELPPAGAIYVAPLIELDAGNGDGSAARPFHRIVDAVTAAVERSGAIMLLAAGSYEETVSIDAVGAYSLQGAWIRDGASWRRDCTAGYEQRTQIVSKTAKGLAVSGADALLLRNLTVRSSSNAALPSPSRYGIHATQTDLILDNVRVLASEATAGADGAVGAVGGAPACTLAPECDATPTAGTSPAAAASAASSGTFEVAGYVPRNGVAGSTPGGVGSAGTPGGQGELATFCSTGATCSGASCTPQAGSVRGGAGRCGCGGAGGGAGAAGKGGGASVGVFVVGKGVKFINSRVSADRGGDGGKGGAGGAGGAGAAGARGANAECWTARCCYCNGHCFAGNNWNACCPGADPTMDPVAGGTAGGAGARGGNGQAGGSGAGGPSYAVVLHSGALRIDDRSQFAFGAGGAAPAGAAAGASGVELIVP